MRNKSIDKLAEKSNYFTVEEARELLDVKPDTLKKILFRLEKSGRIERVEKGKYIIIPLGSVKGGHTLQEYVIASKLTKNYCIAYWSALNRYGYTEQIPATVFVQTTDRKKQTTAKALGINYRFVRVKKEKMFGINTEWIENEKVNITDREKTIIDCLDRPDLCGGIVEAAKAVKSRQYDADKLADYAKRIAGSAVIRRLGYLSGIYGVETGLCPEKTRNYLKLDPAMPENKKVLNAKWRLYLNVPENELRNIE